MLTIILYLKDKINTVKQLVHIPRYWGPVSTVAFTVIYHLGSVAFGYSITGAWLWLFMIIGSVGGLRAGLICAGFISAYSFYAFPDDLSRVIQVAAASFLAVLIVGMETRALRRSVADETTQRKRADDNQSKADIVDSVNGNLKLALGAIDILDSLRFGWDSIEDKNRLAMVEQARGKLADQVTLHRSFRQMARERGFVLGEDDTSPDGT
jgi:hypothetical protein